MKHITNLHDVQYYVSELVVAYCRITAYLAFPVISALTAVNWVPVWLLLTAVGILISLLASLWWLKSHRNTVAGVGTVVNAALLLCTLGYAVWHIVNNKIADHARHAAEQLVNVASLKELDEHLSSLGQQVAIAPGLEHLKLILADGSRTDPQRANAAICLARLDEGNTLRTALQQALTYREDPTRRCWVLGAAPLWVGENNLPVLLELVGSQARLALSEESQLRTSAVAALGIAGPAKFRDQAIRSHITARLLQVQRETLGQDAGFDNLVHWALSRFGDSSERNGIRPGRPSGVQWYRNQAGLIMVRLGKVQLEKPESTRALPPYELSDTEITIEVFRKFVDATQYKTSAEQRGSSSGLNFNYQWSQVKDACWRQMGLPGGRDYDDSQLPVVHVSWVDAAHFCNWLSELEGLQPYYEIEGDRVSSRRAADGYRLPTRAEWVCATLADTRTFFWWGRYEYLKAPDWRTDPDWTGMVANLPDRSIQRMEIADAIAGHDGYAFAAPVASFRPNPLGFFDIIGNVAEWCDWDTQDMRVDTKKPIAGGSWGDELRFCTARHEREDDMTSSHVNVGFRVARKGD